MRTHDGYDAQDSYEHARDAMGENPIIEMMTLSLMEGDYKRHHQMLQLP